MAGRRARGGGEGSAPGPLKTGELRSCEPNILARNFELNRIVSAAHVDANPKEVATRHAHAASIFDDDRHDFAAREHDPHAGTHLWCLTLP